jgi:uncharacterized protein
MLVDGQGGPRDEQRGIDLYRSACDQGSALACNNLGAACLTGKGAPLDTEKAIALFTKACDSRQREGVLHGCFNLGAQMIDGKTPGGVEAAIGLLLAAAHAGSGVAYAVVARRHETGSGVARDPTRAAFLYRHACARGEGTACRWVEGHGGSLSGMPSGTHLCDPDQLDDCRTQCDRGNLPSCESLGRAHERGVRVPRDRGQAQALLTRACEGGELDACALLAPIVADSASLDGHARAVELASKACDGGSAAGCTMVAASHRRGDPAAQELYRRACDWGEGLACKYVAEAASDPTIRTEMSERACRLGTVESCSGAP